MDMIKDKFIISTLINEFRSAKNMIFISVLIALGVNLLTTGLINYFSLDNSPIFLVILGVVLSVGIVLLILFSNVKAMNKNKSIEGYFIYDVKNKNLINIPEYNISGDMHEYLNASFAENKAIKALWEKEPIYSEDEHGEPIFENATGGTLASWNILTELIEYCLIVNLSRHLSSYFNHPRFKSGKVKELSRTDIPSVLLTNRFLNLFSENINNRELFMNESDIINDPNMDWAILSVGDAVYQKFNLVLPINSKVERKDKNTIVLDTKLISLTLSCYFDDTNTVLRSGFTEHYLGIKDFDGFLNNRVFKFDINVDVKFKLLSYFSLNRWMYYMWADEFIAKLEDYVSTDAFFDRINWSTVYTLINTNKNIISKTP